MRRIIQKYFGYYKNNKGLFIITIIGSLIFAIIASSVTPIFTKNILQYSNLINNDYDYIYFSQSKKISPNYYFYIDHEILLHTTNHDKYQECDCGIDAEIIMDKDNSNLAPNEIIITENFAKALNLKKGNKIYGGTSVYNTFKEYKIVGVKGYGFGIKENNFGMSGNVLLGYDSDFIKKTTIDTCSFLTNSEAENVTSLAIKSITKKSDLLFKCVTSLFIIGIALVIIFIIFYFSIMSIANPMRAKRIKKIKAYGEKLNIINRLLFFEKLFIVGVFFILSSVISSTVGIILFGKVGLCILGMLVAMHSISMLFLCIFEKFWLRRL